MIRGMMMSLSTSRHRHRHHQCKYIMSFSHFNFECMCRVQSTRATINQRISFITQPICHFSDINLESIVCVCVHNAHIRIFFGGCLFGCYFKNYTFELLNNRYKRSSQMWKKYDGAHTERDPYCSNFSMSFGTLCWLVFSFIPYIVGRA